MSTLVDILRQRATEQATTRAFAYLGDGEAITDSLDYATLDARAAAIATLLNVAPGDRVLLVYDSPLEFLVAFFGCLYARAVAVPTSAPDMLHPERTRERLERLAKNSRPKLVLCEASLQPMLAGLSLPVVAHSTTGPTRPLTAPTPDDIALLQYTSGSTSEPKGVMVTHDNLMANSADIQAAEQVGIPKPRSLTWLPAFHDMGLIVGLLQPVYAGREAIVMQPQAFLERPLRWMQALSRYEVALTGGPNFAYGLCARYGARAKDLALDLSSLRIAYSGAEPIRVETMREFVRVFTPYGLKPEALRGGYGLAEATVLAAGGNPGKGLRTFALDRNKLADGEVTPGTTELAAVGPSCEHARATIVDPQTRRVLPDNRVGEIWLRGRSVARGYFENDAATQTTFQAHTVDDDTNYLRTGDLGFLREGDLFITGRLKDLVIVGGRNFYPQDVEAVAERTTLIREGATVAFAVDDGTRERLVLVSEPVEGRTGSFAARSLARAIRDELDVHVDRVVFVPRGSVQKTTSGKLQRQATKRALESGTLQPIYDWRASETDDLLRTLEEDTLADDTPLDVAGLDSLARLELVYAIEAYFSVSLDRRSLQSLRTIGDLRALLRASAPLHAPPERNEPSVGQAALFRYQSLDPSSLAHNLVLALELSPAPDPALFTRAFAALLIRHPALRTGFAWQTSGLVYKPVTPPELACTAGNEDASTIAHRLAGKPFVLADEAPVRVELQRIDTSRALLVLCAHHIAVDNRALESLVEEWLERYAAALTGRDTPPRREDTSYQRFAGHEHALINGDGGEALRQRWRELLAGARANPVLTKPMRPKPNDDAGVIDLQLAKPSAPGHTPFVVLFATLAEWLRRHTAQCDVTIGVPYTLRDRHEWADTLGYFVNFVPVRVRLDGATTEADVLTRSRAALDEAEAVRALPFANIVEAAGITSTSGEPPLISVSLSLNHLDWADPSRQAREGLRIRPIDVAPLASDVPLALYAVDLGDHWRVRWVYQRARFDETTVRAWADDFARLLDHSAPALPPRPTRTATTLPTPIEAVRRAPQDRIAIVDRHTPMNFAALDRQSNRWANWLRARGVEPGMTVGIYIEPGILFGVAALAIWKAGAVIAPLHVELPSSWLSRAITLLQPKLILHHAVNAKSFPEDVAAVTLVSAEAEMQGASEAPPPPVATERAWRTVWMSKDGMREDSGTFVDIADHAAAVASVAPFDDKSIGLLRSPASSHHAFLQLVTPWLFGRTTYIADLGDWRCPGWLSQHLHDHEVTHVFATPDQLRGTIASVFDPVRRFASVRHVFIHGAALSDELHQRLSESIPLAKVHALYGTAALGRAALVDGVLAPNTTFAIVDHRDRPITRGGRGRLIVRTPERDIDTGDLAEPVADGTFVLAGRSDRLCKIAGFRIDASVIEAAIATHPKITGARLETTRDARGDTRLALYYSGDDAPPQVELKRHARIHLPESLMPHAYVYTKSLSAPLPPPPWLAPKTKPYAAPNEGVEQDVAQVWSELLKLKKVSRHDDFFALGGDSLAVLHAVYQLQQRGYVVQPDMLRAHPVLEAFAAVIKRQSQP